MFKDEIKALPDNPGVYIMRAADDEIIYIGKAKNLKNRVSQYFQSNKSHTEKVARMVSNVVRFEYIITGSEFEALVLECTLIKEHLPKYNILLKDDKSFPYIKITVNEPYPRILLTRKVIKDGARYFGPYLNAAVFNEMMDIAKKVFAVRSCKKVLPRDIGKSRTCLYYSINQCCGPCDGKISQQDYRAIFDDIIILLEGKQTDILDSLTQQMADASGRLEFERAARLRDKIIAIKKITEKQRIVSTNKGNQDVIAMAAENKTVCVQLFIIRDGKMLGRENFIIDNVGGSSPGELLAGFIKQYYGVSTYIPKSILLQHDIDDRELIEKWLSEKCGSSIGITVPKRGEKLSMVKMVEKNALESLKLSLMKSDISKRKLDDLMFELRELMGLTSAPMRIEAYDISNTSGSDNVGVCVVFENGQPKKSDYKKFNIRSHEGANDYESMREVLYRRLTNGMEGNEGFVPLPDLILLDGGKGHVSSVAEVIKFFNLDIPFFGMVKDDRHRTRGLTTDTAEIAVKRQSAAFNFLTAVQDEVHRFAIGAHRRKRTKSTFASELNEIHGVGEKKRAALLKHFKTMTGIKNAAAAELAAVKGIDKGTAEKIFAHFNEPNAEEADGVQS